ncbi:hypothetical protein DWU89_12895, partial [Parabacteroides acidifaciens]
RFITLSVFPSFGNQFARFSKRTAHLFFPIVKKGSLNREKSQSKIDQDFGRNRKTAQKGGYCNFRVCFFAIPHRSVGQEWFIPFYLTMQNILPFLYL